MYTRWARFVSFSFHQTKTTYTQVVCFNTSTFASTWKSLWPVACGNEPTTVRAWRANELVSSRVCVCSTYTMTFFKRRSLVLRWFFAFAWFVAGSLCFVLGPGCLGVLLSSTSPRPACLPSASPPRLSFSARLFFIVGLCKRLPSNSPTRRLAGWLMSFKKA